ncbi:MAG: Endonuclease III [Firmicutes bacterium]|nr:Endonuclease III [Bacillota bacterium]
MRDASSISAVLLNFSLRPSCLRSARIKESNITLGLFAKYKNPAAFTSASLQELENDIRSCGLYRVKAKQIVACCHALSRDHSGQVPMSIDALRALPGVGRKTANVVAYTAFNLPALGVDTHVFRVSRRLGIAHAKTPEKVERELCAAIISLTATH